MPEIRIGRRIISALSTPIVMASILIISTEGEMETAAGMNSEMSEIANNNTDVTSAVREENSSRKDRLCAYVIACVFNYS